MKKLFLAALAALAIVAMAVEGGALSVGAAAVPTVVSAAVLLGSWRSTGWFN